MQVKIIVYCVLTLFANIFCFVGSQHFEEESEIKMDDFLSSGGSVESV